MTFKSFFYPPFSQKTVRFRDLSDSALMMLIRIHHSWCCEFPIASQQEAPMPASHYAWCLDRAMESDTTRLIFLFEFLMTLPCNNFSSHRWLLLRSIISLEFAKWWYFMFTTYSLIKTKLRGKNRNVGDLWCIQCFLHSQALFTLYHQINEDWSGKSLLVWERQRGEHSQKFMNFVNALSYDIYYRKVANSTWE